MINKKIIISTLLIALLTLTVVVAAESLTASENDSFYFYSDSSPASQSGYHAAIVIDGTPYYLSSTKCKEIADHSTTFKEKLNEPHTTDSEIKLDNSLQFTWKTGKVGMNNEAHIVETITF